MAKKTANISLDDMGKLGMSGRSFQAEAREFERLSDKQKVTRAQEQERIYQRNKAEIDKIKKEEEEEKKKEARIKKIEAENRAKVESLKQTRDQKGLKAVESAQNKKKTEYNKNVQKVEKENSFLMNLAKPLAFSLQNTIKATQGFMEGGTGEVFITDPKERSKYNKLSDTDKEIYNTKLRGKRGDDNFAYQAGETIGATANIAVNFAQSTIPGALKLIGAGYIQSRAKDNLYKEHRAARESGDIAKQKELEKKIDNFGNPVWDNLKSAWYETKKSVNDWERKVGLSTKETHSQAEREYQVYRKEADAHALMFRDDLIKAKEEINQEDENYQKTMNGNGGLLDKVGTAAGYLYDNVTSGRVFNDAADEWGNQISDPLSEMSERRMSQVNSYAKLAGLETQELMGAKMLEEDFSKDSGEYKTRDGRVLILPKNKINPEVVKRDGENAVADYYNTQEIQLDEQGYVKTDANDEPVYEDKFDGLTKAWKAFNPSAILNPHWLNTVGVSTAGSIAGMAMPGGAVGKGIKTAGNSLRVGTQAASAAERIAAGVGRETLENALRTEGLAATVAGDLSKLSKAQNKAVTIAEHLTQSAIMSSNEANMNARGTQKDIINASVDHYANLFSGDNAFKREARIEKQGIKKGTPEFDIAIEKEIERERAFFMKNNPEIAEAIMTRAEVGAELAYGANMLQGMLNINEGGMLMGSNRIPLRGVARPLTNIANKVKDFAVEPLFEGLEETIGDWSGAYAKDLMLEGKFKGLASHLKNDLFKNEGLETFTVGALTGVGMASISGAVSNAFGTKEDDNIRNDIREFRDNYSLWKHLKKAEGGDANAVNNILNILDTSGKLTAQAEKSAEIANLLNPQDGSAPDVDKARALALKSFTERAVEASSRGMSGSLRNMVNRMSNSPTLDEEQASIIAEMNAIINETDEIHEQHKDLPASNSLVANRVSRKYNERTLQILDEKFEEANKRAESAIDIEAKRLFQEEWGGNMAIDEEGMEQYRKTAKENLHDNMDVQNLKALEERKTEYQKTFDALDNSYNVMLSKGYVEAVRNQQQESLVKSLGKIRTEEQLNSFLENIKEKNIVPGEKLISSILAAKDRVKSSVPVVPTTESIEENLPEVVPTDEVKVEANRGTDKNTNTDTEDGVENEVENSEEVQNEGQDNEKVIEESPSQEIPENLDGYITLDEADDIAISELSDEVVDPGVNAQNKENEDPSELSMANVSNAEAEEIYSDAALQRELKETPESMSEEEIDGRENFTDEDVQFTIDNDNQVKANKLNNSSKKAEEKAETVSKKTNISEGDKKKISRTVNKGRDKINKSVDKNTKENPPGVSNVSTDPNSLFNIEKSFTSGQDDIVEGVKIFMEAFEAVNGVPGTFRDFMAIAIANEGKASIKPDFVLLEKAWREVNPGTEAETKKVYNEFFAMDDALALLKRGREKINSTHSEVNQTTSRKNESPVTPTPLQESEKIEVTQGITVNDVESKNLSENEVEVQIDENQAEEIARQESIKVDEEFIPVPEIISFNAVPAGMAVEPYTEKQVGNRVILVDDFPTGTKLDRSYNNNVDNFLNPKIIQTGDKVELTVFDPSKDGMDEEGNHVVLTWDDVPFVEYDNNGVRIQYPVGEENFGAFLRRNGMEGEPNRLTEPEKFKIWAENVPIMTKIKKADGKVYPIGTTIRPVNWNGPRNVKKKGLTGTPAEQDIQLQVKINQNKENTRYMRNLVISGGHPADGFKVQSTERNTFKKARLTDENGVKTNEAIELPLSKTQELKPIIAVANFSASDGMGNLKIDSDKDVTSVVGKNSMIDPVSLAQFKSKLNGKDPQELVSLKVKIKDFINSRPDVDIEGIYSILESVGPTASQSILNFKKDLSLFLQGDPENITKEGVLNKTFIDGGRASKDGIAVRLLFKEYVKDAQGNTKASYSISFLSDDKNYGLSEQLYRNKEQFKELLRFFVAQSYLQEGVEIPQALQEVYEKYSSPELTQKLEALKADLENRYGVDTDAILFDEADGDIVIRGTLDHFFDSYPKQITENGVTKYKTGVNLAAMKRGGLPVLNMETMSIEEYKSEISGREGYEAFLGDVLSDTNLGFTINDNVDGGQMTVKAFDAGMTIVPVGVRESEVSIARRKQTMDLIHKESEAMHNSATTEINFPRPEFELVNTPLKISRLNLDQTFSALEGLRKEMIEVKDSILPENTRFEMLNEYSLKIKAIEKHKAELTNKSKKEESSSPTNQTEVVTSTRQNPLEFANAATPATPENVGNSVPAEEFTANLEEPGVTISPDLQVPYTEESLQAEMEAIFGSLTKKDEDNDNCSI